MNKLSFVLWMLGWPLITELSNHWLRLDGKLYASEAETFAAIIEYVIWIIIGIITYKG